MDLAKVLCVNTSEFYHSICYCSSAIQRRRKLACYTDSLCREVVNTKKTKTQTNDTKHETKHTMNSTEKPAVNKTAIHGSVKQFRNVPSPMSHGKR